MAYSRWAQTWPGGGPSWYIYHDVNGTLFIGAPRGGEYLNKEDTKHLRDLLNKALKKWDSMAKFEVKD